MMKLALAAAVLVVSFTSGSLRGGLKEQSSSPSAQEQPAPQRVRVSSRVAQALRVKSVPPHYPKDARAQGIQGSVVLNVVISKDGDVTDLKLTSGHPALAQAAIDSVKQWKYKPYLLNGQAVEVDTQVQVNFTLSAH
jgi:protein TonB